MSMLADAVDAVIGVDTHRDVHYAEIAHPSGAVIAACSVPHTSGGYAQLLAWAREHAPGSRLAASIEGTRSYGAGLARAAAAAGLTVTECEQPARRARRGKGKSDPIDAHLAVLTALRLDTAKLPTPRADGDREALRILLCARQELTATATAQANRLRALLRDGGDHDRALARGRLSGTTLAALVRRASPTAPPAPRRSATPRSAASRWRYGRRPGTEGQPRRTGHDRRRSCPRSDQPPRHRAGQRRPRHRQLLPPRPLPSRRRLRQTRRHQPDRSLQRPDHPPPAQPRRRPRPQPRHPHHRHHPDPRRPRHPRLPHPAARRRQDRPRDPPLPQALHRPAALPNPHHRNDPSRQIIIGAVLFVSADRSCLPGATAVLSGRGC